MTAGRPLQSLWAEQRGPVRYRRNGRVGVGRLVYWPSPGRGRRGRKAVVLTPAGHHVSVPIEDVEVPDADPGN